MRGVHSTTYHTRAEPCYGRNKLTSFRGPLTAMGICKSMSGVLYAPFSRRSDSDSNATPLIELNIPTGVAQIPRLNATAEAGHKPG